LTSLLAVGSLKLAKQSRLLFFSSDSYKLEYIIIYFVSLKELNRLV